MSLTVLSLAAVLAIANAGPTKFEDCGKQIGGMKIHYFELPSTVELDGSNKAKASFSIAEDLSPRDRLKVTLETTLGGRKFVVPCIPFANIGSCDLQLEEWYNKVPRMMDTLMRQFNLPCKAGARKGEYKNDNLNIYVDPTIIPNIPAMGLLINGRYWVKFELSSPGGKPKGCFKLEMNIHKR